MSFISEHKKIEDQYIKSSNKLQELLKQIDTDIHLRDDADLKGEREAYSLYAGACTRHGIASHDFKKHDKHDALMVTYNGDRSERYESTTYGFVTSAKNLVEMSKMFVSMKTLWKHMVNRRDYQGGFTIFPEYISKDVDAYAVLLREAYTELKVEIVSTRKHGDFYVVIDKSRLKG